MKKIVRVISLLFTILIFTGCSTDNKADSADSSAKTESSSTVDKKKKAEEEKAKEEEKKKEAEKKKQEEIAKKVTEADTAMKAAEANLTDETLAAAKKAIEAIPGGNNELAKRLETATANLENSRQPTTAQQNQQQTYQPQTVNPDPDFIDADGNGFDDRSVFNDPAARAEYARGEAEAQQQWEQQQNAVAERDQFASDFEAQHGRQPTSGEIQSQWLQKQGLSGGY